MTFLNQTKQDVTILEKVMFLNIPAYRDAYSDRTAWLMACFAELAYLRFDKMSLTDPKIKERFVSAVESLISDTEKVSQLNSVVNTFITDHEKEMGTLGTNLGLLSYKLDTVFDNNDTQAILVRDDNEKRLVLAFRGTEPKVIRDIKADLDAKLESTGGGKRTHRGFTKAYLQVGPEIQARLSNGYLGQYKLYITGHSLGGALACIAAKTLNHKGGISACYTFGSPRVGNKDWVAEIKPPMYRIVNSSDAVPMMPPGATGLSILAFFTGGIPIIGKSVKIWMTQYIGYFHSGDMRYLGRSKNADLSDTKLYPHTNSFIRIWLWVKTKIPALGVQDHSVSVYRRKLGVIAITRNKS